MRYLVTKEIKSETQVFWKLYIRDFVFLVVWSVLNIQLGGAVHRYLQIPFTIFAILCGVVLVLPSNTNPKRRQYQAAGLFLSRPKGTYYYLKEEEDGEEKTGRKKYKRRHSGTSL